MQDEDKVRKNAKRGQQVEIQLGAWPEDLQIIGYRNCSRTLAVFSDNFSDSALDSQS
jgi:hypothetical protein